ncbi:MAG: ATP synthase F1 subunit epsilon [Oscillospiraceae bacterium]|nr:ATP synthase F1 subunit epsilon [Oscillospiraceae bacterium]
MDKSELNLDKSEDGLSLTILTPERDFFHGEAEQVVFSTPEGSIGIMSGHAPMVASVAEGIIEILSGGAWKTAATGQGFAEIAYGKAEFFVDTAEWADEIDAIRAKEALERAEHRLRSNMSRIEFLRTQAAMSRAIARLKTIETSTTHK